MKIDNSILWITPKWPLPAHDGAKVATTQLLKHSTRLGLKIDLLSLIEPSDCPNVQEARNTLGVRNVFLLNKPPTSTGLKRYLKFLSSFLKSPQRPITIAPFSSPTLQSQFEQILTSRPYTIVFDGLHTAALKSTATSIRAYPKGSTLIYRAHNVEADLWVQSAQQSRFFLKKLFFQLQAKNVERFEQSLISAASLTATVSEADLLRFQKNCPEMNGFNIPIGIDIPAEEIDPPLSDSGRNTLLFLGKLDWTPNSEGLKWFLRKIWPKVQQRRPSLKLRIAGKGNGKWLSEFANLPNLEILGFVENTKPLYEECVLAIIPIFLGSGTRVKVIEASTYSRVTLSTALGVEGTSLVPHESYFRADTENEWLSALSRFQHDQAITMGHKAFEQISKNFCAKLSAEKFASSLSNSSSSSFNRYYYGISG